MSFAGGGPHPPTSAVVGIHFSLLYVPTLTDVLPSSSDALLPPPCLLLKLIRLELLPACKMALIGRAGGGEAGGLAIAAAFPALTTKRVACLYIIVEFGLILFPEMFASCPFLRCEMQSEAGETDMILACAELTCWWS